MTDRSALRSSSVSGGRRKLPHRRIVGVPKAWARWLAFAFAYAFAYDFGLFDGFLMAAGGGEGGHGTVAPVLAGIVTILLVAKLGGDLFERIGMPAVLGELIVGVILGNFEFLFGVHPFDYLMPNTAAGEVLLILAEIGVILLLFEVGLESRVADLVSVGSSALLVAILGVVAPIALGYGTTVLLTDHGWEVALFIGATLCATSVGITARVLRDLGKSQEGESRIILGAAVIDDVLGLIVLAVVSGVIASQPGGEETGDKNPVAAVAKAEENETVTEDSTAETAAVSESKSEPPGDAERLGDEKKDDFSGIDVLIIIGKAVGFLALAMLLGALRFPKLLFEGASFLRGHGLLVTTALVICFTFAWGAAFVGMAPIIGAFAAGLILERAQFRQEGQMHELEEAIAPLSALLVPIFFVEMGMQVSLESFADQSVWLLAGAITIAAIVGKQVCSLGVLQPGMNKVAIGLGMIPRGEVGLIFANEGRRLRSGGEEVIDSSTYSAIVVMVMITTLVTPPLLKWSLGSSDGSDVPPEDDALPVDEPPQG